MNKFTMHVVKDSLNNDYGVPYPCINCEMAKRDFAYAVNDPAHQYGKHPADYTLFHVGFSDPTTGLLHPMDTPLKLASGHELLTPKGSN